MSILSENSKVSLSLVIALLGGAAWITTIHVTSQSNAAELRDVKEKVAEITEVKADIKIIRSDVEHVKRLLKAESE